MRALTGRAFATSLLCAGAALSTAGCYRNLKFDNPNRTEAVTMSFPTLTNDGTLYIWLHREGRREAVETWSGEVFVDFAHILWIDAWHRPDQHLETAKAVVVIFNCGDPPIRVAVDRTSGSRMPFGDFVEALKADIRVKYGLGGSEDPLKWACSNHGTKEFFRRFGL